MERPRSSLATKATLAPAAAIATTMCSPSPALAGIPVIDGGNLVQNIRQAMQLMSPLKTDSVVPDQSRLNAPALSKDDAKPVDGRSRPGFRRPRQSRVQSLWH